MRVVAKFVEPPTVIEPAHGTVDVDLSPTIKLSDFVAEGITDTPVSTRCQISLNVGFTNIFYDSQWMSYTTAHALPQAYRLTQGVTYFVRAAHMGQELGASSWSTISRFTVIQKYVAAPNILNLSHQMWGPLPTWGDQNWMGAAFDVSLTPLILLSEFMAINAADSANGTRGQIATDAGFLNITHDTGWQPYTTSYQVPESSKLSQTTQYFVRFMHRGAVLGESAWSAASFITEEDS